MDTTLGCPAHGRPGAVPFIPLEFADAAYRYGHSQIRHLYRANLAGEPAPLFPDYLGFRPVPPSRRVDWRLFFDGFDGIESLDGAGVMNGASGAPRAPRAQRRERSTEGSCAP